MHMKLSLVHSLLLDSGATHSFISNMFVANINREVTPLLKDLCISTYVDDVFIVSSVYTELWYDHDN